MTDIDSLKALALAGDARAAYCLGVNVVAGMPEAEAALISTLSQQYCEKRGREDPLTFVPGDEGIQWPVYKCWGERGAHSVKLPGIPPGWYVWWHGGQQQLSATAYNLWARQGKPYSVKWEHVTDPNAVWRDFVADVVRVQTENIARVEEESLREWGRNHRPITAAEQGFIEEYNALCAKYDMTIEARGEGTVYLDQGAATFGLRVVRGDALVVMVDEEGEE